MEQVHEVLNETVLPYLQLARLHINDFCKSLEAWQIILYTAGLTVVLSWLSDLLFQPESLHVRIKRAVLRLIRKIPAVQRKLQSEILNQEQSCGEGYTKDKKDFSYVTSLPPRGLPLNDLMREIEKYQKLATVNWSDGKVSGVVYSGAPQLTQLMSQVFGQFAWSNPLHPDVFPDVRKMEAEAVRMACTMFNGGPETCGAMTSGGTESIMLACKAYRDMAYERGVKHPEMVIPVSAHAAFDKSCQYFNIRLVHVPLDDKTMRVDVAAMKRRITKNTIMLVGSAPQFPHGAIDPIEEIAALGLKYNIPVHVDSCLGGFLVPFMRKAGFELAPFDFSVPGVTSISADTHKYGFAPKGSSVILYSNTNYRSYQFFVAPEWQGGIYASQTFGGSRSGAVIAVCWATMMHIGEQGYIDSTRKIITTTRYIQEGLKKIDNIFVFGKPEVSVIAVGTLDFNIYRLSDGLTAKGWNLNSLQNPACFHLCCTLIHTNPGVADMFLRDVRDCMAEIMKNPQADAKGGSAAIYGQAQSIPDKTMLSQVITGYLNAYYSTTMPSPSHNGVNHH